MIGLVWNSMMSMAGGWFFLTVNEAFTLGNHDFRLPGIGSYMSVAIDRGDARAMAGARRRDDRHDRRRSTSSSGGRRWPGRRSSSSRRPRPADVHALVGARSAAPLARASPGSRRQAGRLLARVEPPPARPAPRRPTTRRVRRRIASLAGGRSPSRRRVLAGWGRRAPADLLRRSADGRASGCTSRGALGLTFLRT